MSLIDEDVDIYPDYDDDDDGDKCDDGDWNADSAAARYNLLNFRLLLTSRKVSLRLYKSLFFLRERDHVVFVIQF